MMTLLQLQKQFQAFLLSEQTEIHEAIVQTNAVCVETRLGIYRDAYILRLIDSLKANFPSLYLYLGTEEFNCLSRAYINAHPSSYRSIRWFGDVLAEFIKNYYPQDLHLAELADFEWKMTLAFDAADSSVIQVDEMAAVAAEAWSDLQFVMHPSVQRCNYFYKTVSLWQALMHDHDLPEKELATEANAWVMWRTPEYTIQFYSFSPEEAWAFDTLMQGTSFAVLCEGLCEWISSEEVGLRAASYLKKWIQWGLIAQLVVKSEVD
ncbi:MAG: DNA-binding domain-containing protein [Legionella sp.]|uniref:HvfC/BufC N-terminal domain-containing protein n=1 Tax=Legionella sp. TaxID=459 RepID=UPI0039E62F09